MAGFFHGRTLYQITCLPAASTAASRGCPLSRPELRFPFLAHSPLSLKKKVLTYHKAGHSSKIPSPLKPNASGKKE
jgi:hypothetical protein